MASNPLHPTVIPLYGSSRHQSWGKGSESEAARILTLNRFCALDPKKPYSEFVVSSHNAHEVAVLATTPSTTLRDHIHSLVIEVEPAMVDFYSRLHSQGVPYVLKIVSVSTAQSVHVHPDTEGVKKILGSELGDDVDAVSKAVMMVALGKVEVLFGFQPAAQIVVELSRVPEFADAVGRPQTDHFVHVVKTSSVKSSDIREVVSNLLGRKREFIRKCLQATTDRFSKMPEEAVTESDRELIALQKQFPDDPMCFAVYLLNRIKLEPGKAIFIHPQEPYSVLSGDFVEASTCSEVSVAAGFCGEGVQVNQFLDSLSYDDSAVEVSSGEQFSEYGVSYVPPVPQFQLLAFKLPRNVSQKMIETIAPSIILVLDGEGCIKVEGQDPLLPLRPGSVYYLKPQTQFEVISRCRKDTVLHFIQIGVNESFAPSSSSSCVVM